MKRFTILAVAVLFFGLCVPTSQASEKEGCCAKKPESASSASCGLAAGSSGCASHAPKTAAAATSPRRPLTPQLEPVFARYIDMQTELAKDSTKGLGDASKAMAGAMKRSGSGCLSGSASTAEAVGLAKDIKTARTEFAKLSELMFQFVSIANVDGYHGFYCQMAKAGWLQTDIKMRNPYMGAAMLECGQKVM